LVGKVNYELQITNSERLKNFDIGHSPAPKSCFAGWQSIAGEFIIRQSFFKKGYGATYKTACYVSNHSDVGAGTGCYRSRKGLAETAASDVKATEEKNEPGAEAKTWVFVMTLCFSRHMYAEIVTDQKVGTWLACHRRAFEFFNGVPARRPTQKRPKTAI
jgi:hypothetical protein